MGVLYKTLGLMRHGASGLLSLYLGFCGITSSDSRLTVGSRVVDNDGDMATVKAVDTADPAKPYQVTAPGDGRRYRGCLFCRRFAGTLRGRQRVLYARILGGSIGHPEVLRPRRLRVQHNGHGT